MQVKKNSQAAAGSSMYAARRQALVTAFKAAHPDVKQAHIVFISGWHQGIFPFVADSTHWYYTGLREPGTVLVLDLDGKATLYIPGFEMNRADWLTSEITATPECARVLGVDVIVSLGEPQQGYEPILHASHKHYAQLLEFLERGARAGVPVYTLLQAGYLQYQAFWQHMRLLSQSFSVQLHDVPLRDVSGLVARQRSIKSEYELEQLYKAVEITMMAQDAAARAMQDRITERDLKAGIEYVFAQDGAVSAFPSIVASGASSTVLHYNDGARAMRDGDVVVVDIGARYNYYCADITRTYPVSGRFSARQRELYQMVHEVHEYVASLAKPGIFLRNAAAPTQSLHHLAVAYFEKKGMAKYFMHGIGHYLGIDVHDVGDYTQPLQEGQVFTIEPGLYLKQEAIGIRIEDDYVITRTGARCLSAELPSDLQGVQAMACQTLDDEDEDEE